MDGRFPMLIFCTGPPHSLPKTLSILQCPSLEPNYFTESQWRQRRAASWNRGSGTEGIKGSQKGDQTQRGE